MSNRHAFLLACEDYSHPQFRQLLYPAKDAELLRKTLVELCDYSSGNIVLEISKGNDPVAPAHVLSALKRFVDGTQVGDTILFYFAGYGAASDGIAYIALPDSDRNNLLETAVSIDDINSILQVPDRFYVRIFDSCHSGAGARSAHIGSDIFIESVMREGPARCMYVTLASCEADEESYEDKTMEQGVYTACLCDAIKALQEDAPVEAHLLHKEVYKRVVEVGERTHHLQHPIKSGRIGGSDEFARRIVAKPVAIPVDSSNTPESEVLRRRLEAEEATYDLLIANRPEELARISEIAEELLSKRLIDLTDLAIDPKIQIGHTGLIPESWHRSIVTLFEERGYRSPHEISSYETEDALLSRIVPAALRTKQRKYIVLGYGPGKPVTTLKWKGNDYRPGGMIVCYVIPLETKVFVLVLLRVESVIAKDSNFRYALAWVDNLEADWLSILAPAIETAIAVSSERIEASVLARLNYRDRERASFGNIE